MSSEQYQVTLHLTVRCKRKSIWCWICCSARVPLAIMVENKDGVLVGDVMGHLREVQRQYQQAEGKPLDLRKMDLPTLCFGRCYFDGSPDVVEALKKAADDKSSAKRTATAAVSS